MLARFQTSYGRVEASLQRLTDSIAAYSPSTVAAADLLAADEAVNVDLDELVTHQRNHARLEQLRRSAATLDDTIKATVKLLADTRKSIQAISPVNDSSEARRGVSVDEVLSYARFISKTTVPPTFRPQATPPATATAAGEGAGAKTPGLLTNGASSHVDQAPAEDNPAYIQTRNSTIGLDVLPEQDKTWLDPAATLPFEPWPSHAVIQSGALASIQKMVEAGQDPADVLSAEEQAEVDRQRAEEEERELVQQKERERIRREAFDVQRRSTVETTGGFNPDDL